MKQNRNHAQRNLYVLNLPLDATTDQFESLFGEHGHVDHAVILATLDNVARRRGFILMSSPAEAKNALERLDGFSWHGYRIEVSYAIVQRSGTPFTPRSPCDDIHDTASVPQMHRRAREQAQGVLPQVAEISFSPATSQAGTVAATLFIQNLDANVLSSESHLRALVEPFGHIRDLQATSGGFEVGGASASVLYCCQHSASVAKYALDGLVIGSCVLSACLARDVRPAEVEPCFRRQAQGTRLSFNGQHSSLMGSEHHASTLSSGPDPRITPQSTNVGTVHGTWNAPFTPAAERSSAAVDNPPDWKQISEPQASLPLSSTSGPRDPVVRNVPEWGPSSFDDASFDLWTSKGMEINIWAATQSQSGTDNEARKLESGSFMRHQPSGQCDAKDMVRIFHQSHAPKTMDISSADSLDDLNLGFLKRSSLRPIGDERPRQDKG